MRLLYRRLLLHHQLANGDREIELVLCEQVFGNRCQHGPGLRMLWIGVREFQGAVEVLLMPG